MSDAARGHLRPAGRCRVYEAGLLAHRAVVLENRWLRATVLPDRGGVLHELVHKPTDTDLLWRWDRGLPAPTSPAPSLPLPQGGYQDAFTGGWDLTFPAVARLQAGAGSVVGSHGETWALPWTATIERDEPDGVRLVLRTRCRRTPFDLRRTLELGEGPQLRCVTRVVNRGSRPHPWAMGEHAVWDVGTALSAGGRIEVSGEVTTAPDQPSGSSIVPGRTGPWPVVDTADSGRRDLSDLGPQVRGSTGLAAVRVDAGEVVLRGGQRPTVRLGWDHDLLPHLLVWMPFGGDHGPPWFGTVQALGLEPVSVPPWADESAFAELAPGEELTTAWHVTLDDTVASA